MRRYGSKCQVVLANYNILWQPKEDALKDKRAGVRNRARAQKRFLDMLIKWAPDSVVLDEVHRIKSRSSRQSQYAGSFARRPFVKRRIGLTGTPVTKGIEDLFAIYRFIDPEVFGTRWVPFSGHYLNMGGYFGHEIKGYFNEDEAAEKVALTSFVISKGEALDLPERQDVIVEYELTPRTRKLYDKFKKESLAEIEGVDGDGKPLRGLALARIVLTSIIRQQQIASGWINTDNGIIDIGHEKLDQALDLISDAIAPQQQVVVFVSAHHDIDRIKAALPKTTKYGVYAGGRYTKTREKDRNVFSRGKLNILIVEISAGSESIDLSAASIGIFYSLNHSLKDYAQARDRLHRIGQVNRVTYYILLGTRTVEMKMFDGLGNKQDIASKVSSLDYAKRILT